MTDPRRYAILIGNSEFPEAATLDALRCPPRDIQGMREVLLAPASQWFTDAELLLNEAHATVRNRIQRVFKQAAAHDQILLYYSGHGKLDQAGRLYLATKDTEEEYLETTSVELSLLRRLITNNPCKRVALILDCCHSGAAVADMQAKGHQAAVVAQRLDELAAGIHVLSATTASQQAYEKEGDDYSLFTKHLLEGLRHNRADMDGDGWVSINDLYDYVRQHVGREAAQTPRYKGVEVESGKYIIARAERVYGDALWQAFKTKLLGVEDEIDDDVFEQAYRVIKERAAQRDKQWVELLEALTTGELKPAKFSGRWLKLSLNVSAPAIVASPVQPIVAPLKKPANFTEMLNGVPLEMIYVPGGEFMMGSPKGEGSDSERPKHKVVVPALHVGKYQITQAQWKAVMEGKNPSNFKGGDLPVEQVNWHDAKAFCQKVKKLTGKDYRLPSEAEWEYACRAGTTGDYAGDLENMAWYDGNAKGTTHPVGEKDPNGFGLYDMHGNVWEWCEDVWHENYQKAPTDGSAWLSGGDSSRRVLRGGSWGNASRDCRSALRISDAPGYRSDYSGFRLVVGSRTP